MPILFQINTFCNTGSTGRIAEDLGKTVIENGWESWIAYGRTMNPSQSNIYKIGNDWDIRWHGLQTRLFDRQGLASKHATKKLIQKIQSVNPDIIHLHNLHGYYLNYPLLFKFLKEYNHPVIWTLHDCWSFTGHCPQFEYENCFKWKEECYDCVNKRRYPASVFLDRSTRNYEEKKHWFTSLNNLTIIPVSEWLANYVRKSYLHKFTIKTIHNGIDTDVFKPLNSKDKIFAKYNLKGKFLIIGVAGVWESMKGLEDFNSLRQMLGSDYNIMVIGVSKRQKKELPEGIIGVERTESVTELAEIYSAANVLFNPTLEDTLPTVNLEAQSCGTPVVSYKTGGSPETIMDNETGYIIAQKDFKSSAHYIQLICSNSKAEYQNNCRKNILLNFKKQERYNDYMELYNLVINRGGQR